MPVVQNYYILGCDVMNVEYVFRRFGGLIGFICKVEDLRKKYLLKKCWYPNTCQPTQLLHKGVISTVRVMKNSNLIVQTVQTK
jgi:hypothetical protein